MDVRCVWRERQRDRVTWGFVEGHKVALGEAWHVGRRVIRVFTDMGDQDVEWGRPG